jgi:peptide methionine sulfoxide reductase MsrB
MGCEEAHFLLLFEHSIVCVVECTYSTYNRKEKHFNSAEGHGHILTLQPWAELYLYYCVLGVGIYLTMKQTESNHS